MALPYSTKKADKRKFIVQLQSCELVKTKKLQNDSLYCCTDTRGTSHNEIWTLVNFYIIRNMSVKWQFMMVCWSYRLKQPEWHAVWMVPSAMEITGQQQSTYLSIFLRVNLWLKRNEILINYSQKVMCVCVCAKTLLILSTNLFIVPDYPLCFFFADSNRCQII